MGTLPRVTRAPGRFDSRLRSSLLRWGKLWHVHALDRLVTVSYSSRLTTSLGRCNPARGEIRITTRLKDAGDQVLFQVVCHEAAHVATYLRFGPTARPHGPEWAGMVTAAGYPPVRKLVVPGAKHASRHAPSALYEHYCPVCQQARFARRPVPGWRCADCTALGRDGHLVVERHNPPDRSRH